MSYIPKKVLGTSLILVGLIGFSGCASKHPDMSSLERQLAAKQERIEELEMSKSDMQRVIDLKNADLERQKKAGMHAGHHSGMAHHAMHRDGASLPPKARAGECYARVLSPPVYRTETKNVLKRDASERLEIVPAKYEWVDEQVMVKSPSEKIEVVPATYEWIEEKMMVKAASTRSVQVPAVYETVTERVVDTPARTVWKKGRGPFEKIDHATGEIMCLVEVPATYKTVTTRVLKTPARTRTVEISAEYKTVRKRIMKTPPSTRTVQIPGQYKTMRVKRVATPEQVRRIPVPARYEKVVSRVEVGGGEMMWQPVLCRTNATPATVRQIQRALKQARHYHGALDGIYGPQTRRAMASYQRAKGLTVCGMTFETLRSLGLKLHHKQVVAGAK